MHVPHTDKLEETMELYSESFVLKSDVGPILTSLDIGVVFSFATRRKLIAILLEAAIPVRLIAISIGIRKIRVYIFCFPMGLSVIMRLKASPASALLINLFIGCTILCF